VNVNKEPPKGKKIDLICHTEQQKTTELRKKALKIASTAAGVRSRMVSA